MRNASEYKKNLLRFLDVMIHPMGKFMGTLAYFVDIRHRRIVRRNLRSAYPNWSKERVRMISHRVFQHVGITFLEIFQMTFLERQDILQKLKIRNGHHIEAALNDKNGFIIISAHIGNWEMAHVFLSAYYETHIGLVARALDSQLLDRWINGIRSKFGNEIWHKKGALNKMARALRSGGAVGFLIDQEARDDESVPVTFFNQTANATPAAALLARRYGATVLPVFCIREAGNTLVLDVQPPLKLVETQDRQSDIEYNTQMMSNAVEEIVKAYPEQWFWVHKRWKRHHPELYPEDMARHKRRKKKKKAKLMKAKPSA